MRPLPGSPDFACVASSATHALNNIILHLYEVSSQLDTLDDPTVARSRLAVQEACASSQALSAALYLLSLRDVQQQLARKSTLHPFNADDQECVFDSLREVADIRCMMHDPTQRGVLIGLRLETLSALLCCVSYSLRRLAGPNIPVHCYLEHMPNGSMTGCSELVFEFAAPSLGAGDAAAGASAHHPCEYALERAQELFSAPVLSLRGLGTNVIRVFLGTFEHSREFA